MDVAIITGSAGLIGSEAAEFFGKKGFRIIGIDNDMRRYFFGEEASTRKTRERLERNFPQYVHHDGDVRDQEFLTKIFQEYKVDVKLVIHTAAQPSHEWAAQEPLTDFGINAVGTLNLLESTRAYAPGAAFVFLSTSKVYGDRPNALPFVELETRWEAAPGSLHYNGIDESMSVDQTRHSLFGVSKLSADILVQEYGRYFGMKTVCFRAGCLTGPQHAGTMLHGFLSYLMKCCRQGKPYTILGYKGKQVRDNVHSYDVVTAIEQFCQNPRCGEVYNVGGGRENNCSLLEAIALCEEITGKKLSVTCSDQPRTGDHKWYVSNLKKFQQHYPGWRQTYSVRRMLEDNFSHQTKHSS